MVDIATLALTHGLMAIALWRLLSRDDLDRDAADAVKAPRPWHRKPAAASEEEG